jgi:elongation factor P
MDPQTFDQVRVPASVLGADRAAFVREGDAYPVLLHDDEGLEVRLPARVSQRVAATEDAARGDTVNAVLKAATLDNGVVVRVPAFVKTGDAVVVDPETREYLGRA